ncbi:metallophosphoesterase [Tateyamaria sp. Alg231-49]|uniref:metallophosphoesterase family protein n=1 Tax=Tateyamaria sp. Alg231-49 TaxID=1922219 RepID=UPI000D551D1A|nr:metallophosphoesterase [Tateyamaria sp. Alg231-49]
MVDFKFVHTSDLHLGSGFGTMPEELRGRLIEARHEVLSRLVQSARDHGAQHILVAGDTFDTTGPSAGVRRQAATKMSADSDVHWWIIPGNHDSLAAEELWRLFEEETGPNVHVLRESEPVEIAEGVWLLPSPWPRQFPGFDLTAWMTDAATPENALRIGLAHGGITDFGDNYDASTLIPPNRAESAQLDYLALGDWHGMVDVNPRTQFSGTPERDSYRHDGRGSCHLVTIAGPGAVPSIKRQETGRFYWSAKQLNLSPNMDVVSAFQELLDPETEQRRDQLLRIEAEGYLHMEERAALEDAASKVAPDFGRFVFLDSKLATEYQADDLDLIATGGALRVAAEELQVEAEGHGVSEQDARLAQAALNRLWSLVREG